MENGEGQDEGGKDEGREEAEESEEVDESNLDNKETGYLASFYFGTPNPDGRHSSQNKNNRNEKALDALLDVCTYSADTTDQSSQGKPNRKTPLIIFVHGVEKMLQLSSGLRLLAGLRDAIWKRRKAGIPIYGVFFRVYVDSYFEDRARKKVGARVRLKLPTSVTEHEDWKRREAASNLISNLKGLKGALQKRYSHLVDERIVDEEADWNLERMAKITSFLSYATINECELDHIAKLIAIHTWGRSKIDLKDIFEILDKMESDRIENIAKGNDEKAMSDLTDDERDLARYLISPGQFPVTYDDVIMDSVTKATVRQFVALSRLKLSSRSSISAYLKMSGILLFGPPGTGKTHLCRAIANDSGQKFIALSAAGLNSRYVGETEKKIGAMFSLARKLHPCIIFLDEVDSLFYRRADNNKSWERSALAQYLQEMDGLAAENNGSKAPLVIVATNRPADLDEAFLRRLPYRVFLTIPTYDERRNILERMIPSDNLAGNVELEDIAKRAEGFSGSDLRTLCSQAALSWATELELTTGEAFEGQHIRLSKRNFEQAFGRTGPSASPEMIKSLEDFNKRFQY